MYHFFIVIAIFLFSACSVKKTAITEYTINTHIHKSELNATKCIDKSLKISQAFSSSELMSLKMNYKEGDYKQFFYSQSQWADSPNRVITTQIVKLLRESKLFQSVQTDKSRTNSEYILETNIEDFMQYFSKNSKDSFVNIVMTITLLDAQTSMIVATKTFSVEMKSDTLDAEGGVSALNQAFEDILVQMRGWLSGVCS